MAASRTLNDRPTLRLAGMVFAAVFLSCLFGILTRPTGFLASFWPVNAIMLGLLVINRSAVGPIVWAAGLAAFVLADLITGAALVKALLLTGANIAGIATAYVIFGRFPPDIIRLRSVDAVGKTVLATAGGAAAAAFGGAGINPYLFDGSVIDGWMFWFSTELANFLTILPLLLAIHASRTEHSVSSSTGWNPLPGLSLLGSFVAGFAVGGPGAIVFPVPALLWCGLIYSPLLTAALTLSFSIWTLIVLSLGHVASLSDINALISIRLAVVLVALAPLMLATATQERARLLRKLKSLATHDQLTGTLTRGAFYELAAKRLKEKPAVIMLIDVDHFKSINDAHGHMAGDTVLSTISARLHHMLGPDDLLGRIGGEEFAVLLAVRDMDTAKRVAEKFGRTVAGEVIDGERKINVTVSAGLAATTGLSLEEALHHADMAMYRSKADGRDRVTIFGPELLTSFSGTRKPAPLLSTG